MLGLKHDSFAAALHLAGPPAIDLSAERMPALQHGPVSSYKFPLDLSSEGTSTLPHNLRNPGPLFIASIPPIGLLNKKLPALPHGPVSS